MKIGHARRVISRRKLLYFAGIVFFLLLTLAFSMLTMSTIYDYWFGPFEKDLDDLLALPQTNNEFHILFEKWIILDVDANYQISEYYTGYREEGSRLASFYVMVAQLDDHLLIIRADNEAELDLNTLHLTGNLWHDRVVPYIPFYDDVREEFREQYPDVNGEFLPLTFNVSATPSDGIAGMFALILIPLLMVIFLLSMLFRLIILPNKVGLMHKLETYGDPIKVLAEIEHELAQDYTLCIKRYCFTEHWFIYAPFNDFQAMQYEDIMWFYRLPESWYLYIYDRYGTQILVTFPRDTIIETLVFEVPWAIQEYTPEIKKQWKRYQQKFIKEIDKKRLEYEKPKKRDEQIWEDSDDDE